MNNNLNAIAIYDILRIQNNFFTSGLIDQLEKDLSENASDYIVRDNFNVRGVIEKYDKCVSSECINDIISLTNMLDYIYNVSFIIYMSSKVRKIQYNGNIMSFLVNNDITNYILDDQVLIKKIKKETDLFEFIKENESKGFFHKILNETVMSSQKYKDVVFDNIGKSLHYLMDINEIKNAHDIVNSLKENIYKKYKNKKLTDMINDCPTDFLKGVFVIKNNIYDNNGSVFKSFKLDYKYAVILSHVSNLIDKYKNHSTLYIEYSGKAKMRLDTYSLSDVMIFFDNYIYDLNKVFLNFKINNNFKKGSEMIGESVESFKTFRFKESRIELIEPSKVEMEVESYSFMT